MCRGTSCAALLAAIVATSVTVAADDDPTSRLSEDVERGLASPAALASADFDNDGVPDLACGYSGHSRGRVTLHLGRMEAIFPDSAVARQRWIEGTAADSTFFPPERKKNASEKYIEQAAVKLEKEDYQRPDPAVRTSAETTAESGSCTVEQISAMAKAGLSAEQIKAACKG